MVTNHSAMKVIVSIFLTLLMLSSALLAQDNALITLTDTQGRELRAELLRVTAGIVQLRHENGTEYTIELTRFNADSQKAIETWNLEKQLSDKLEINFHDVRVEKRKSNTTARETKRDIRRLNVSFANSSTTTIQGLSVEFRIYIEEERINRADKSFEREVVFDGEFSVDPVGPGVEVEANSNTFELKEQKMLPGWVSSTGDKRKSEDKVRGVWVKVYHKGKLIYSESKPKRIKEAKKW